MNNNLTNNYNSTTNINTTIINNKTNNINNLNTTTERSIRGSNYTKINQKDHKEKEKENKISMIKIKEDKSKDKILSNYNTSIAQSKTDIFNGNNIKRKVTYRSKRSEVDDNNKNNKKEENETEKR